jgi:hypothetical protein
MRGAQYDAITMPEAEAAPGSRQCATAIAVQFLRTAEEFRRRRDFTERCPERATNLVLFSCPNEHSVIEETCDEHAIPSDIQFCDACASDGMAARVTPTVIRRI